MGTPDGRHNVYWGDAGPGDTAANHGTDRAGRIDSMGGGPLYAGMVGRLIVVDAPKVAESRTFAGGAFLAAAI
jgi:hypothetical protein